MESPPLVISGLFPLHSHSPGRQERDRLDEFVSRGSGPSRVSTKQATIRAAPTLIRHR